MQRKEVFNTIKLFNHKIFTDNIFVFVNYYTLKGVENWLESSNYHQAFGITLGFMKYIGKEKNGVEKKKTEEGKRFQRI